MDVTPWRWAEWTGLVVRIPCQMREPLPGGFDELGQTGRGGKLADPR